MAAYEDVDVIHDPDGVSVRITQRASSDGTAQFSCQFFREYHKAGEKHETVWFSRRHLEAIQRLVRLADLRIAKEYTALQQAAGAGG